MENYEVKNLEAEVSVPEYVKTCVDVEKFLGCCAACPNYEKVWACPPFSFDPMEIWNRYQVLKLYARVVIPGKDMNMEGLMQAFQQEKLRLSEELLKRETSDSLSLAAGTCLACSPCLRTQGKPCCHPEQLRYSIEALGGDVCKTLETYLHLPLQWAQNGQMPEYMTLAAGLLVKNQESKKSLDKNPLSPL